MQTPEAAAPVALAAFSTLTTAAAVIGALPVEQLEDIVVPLTALGASLMMLRQMMTIWRDMRGWKKDSLQALKEQADAAHVRSEEAWGKVDALRLKLFAAQARAAELDAELKTLQKRRKDD